MNSELTSKTPTLANSCITTLQSKKKMVRLINHDDSTSEVDHQKMHKDHTMHTRSMRHRKDQECQLTPSLAPHHGLHYTIVRFMVPMPNQWYQSLEFATHDIVEQFITLCCQYNPIISVGHGQFPMMIRWSDVQVQITDQVPIEELITYRHHLSCVNIFMHAFSASLNAIQSIMSDAQLLIDCVAQFQRHHQLNMSQHHHQSLSSTPCTDTSTHDLVDDDDDDQQDPTLNAHHATMDIDQAHDYHRHSTLKT